MARPGARHHIWGPERGRGGSRYAPCSRPGCPIRRGYLAGPKGGVRVAYYRALGEGPPSIIGTVRPDCEATDTVEGGGE